jgi:hypothetical protein
MDSIYIYQIIGAIHIIGFVIYMAVLKFGFKKSITEKTIGYYVLVWLIGLLVFSITVATANDVPIDIAATIGETLGLGLGFLIIDGIAWYIGKWFYEKSPKTNEKIVCWSCRKKIPDDEEYHEWEDSAVICNDCFKIYEQDEDKILAKIEQYEKEHSIKK